MISAAGIFFLTPEGQALFLKRGPGGDHTGEWCFPGGRQEDGESIEETAIRKTEEEAGVVVPESELKFLSRSIARATETPQPPEGAGDALALPEGEPLAEEVDFTTFLARVAEPFPVEICEESSGFAWASLDDPPQPLHPGCAKSISRFGMDERQLAEAMSRGEFTSPQDFHNSTLFDIRITGTGKAYRPTLDEFVWRDAALYLNDHFLNRCNGLFVIYYHPPKGSLDSKEFGKRIVGSVMLAYIKGEEVWGIARIMDDEVIALMRKGDLSTSPGVVFKDTSGNFKATDEDGATWLFEGKPTLLDHIAICGLGVWDKGGGPEGIIVVDSVEPVQENCLDFQVLVDSVSGLELKLALRAFERKLVLMEN